jgi:carbamoyl-phosphate synthase large subunit
MAKVMIIAGGKWQCPIVKLAKSMGHYVICSNLYSDSPAFEYADVALVADVHDKEKNLEYAKEYKPDVVLTEQTDIAVPTVAYISEKMGLKGIPLEIAERFTNKHIMRELTDKAGFASPAYALCHTKAEAENFVKKTGKSIMKPLDSQSSRGCHIVTTAEEVETYFDDCIQYSNRDKAIVIEEFIDGTEFTVDGLKTEDEYIVTAISEKEHYAYNENVAKRLVFSQSNDRFNYDELRRINAEMVAALELPFGLTHAEYKYRDGKFYLIEIAARGGGTRISSDIVPIMSGINSNEIYLKTLLNEKVEIQKGEKHGVSMLGFFDIKPGLVKSIRGIEEAKSFEGVVDVEIEIKAGERIEEAKDDRSRCGYYIIYAESMEELKSLEDRLLNTVRVEISENE